MAQDHSHSADAPQSSPFRQLDETDYFNYLARLSDEGALYVKTKPRFAYLIPPLVINTQGNDGKPETSKSFPVEHYIVFDPDIYPRENQRLRILQKTFGHYARKIITQDDVNGPDFEGPDLWTMETKKFDADYESDGATPNKFVPKNGGKGAGRLCLEIDEDISWHVPWGHFDIEKGGAIAVREDDVQKLSDAVQSMRGKLQALPGTPGTAAFRAASNNLIRQELYGAPGKDGVRPTILDAYGMKPGFLPRHYERAPG
jgi:hypothetical protein